MAIVKVQSAVVISSTTNATDSYTSAAFNVGSGADRFLAIHISGETWGHNDGSASVLAVSFGGAAATVAVTSGQRGRAWSATAYLVNPATGLGTLSLTTGGNQTAMSVAIIEYTGVDQSAPVTSSKFADNFGGTTQSISFTTSNDGAVISGCCAVEANVTPITAGGTATLLHSTTTPGTGTADDDGSQGVAYDTVATAGARSLSFSWASSARHGLTGIEIKPATGGGGTSLTADSLASTSSVGSPALSQVHALAGAGLAALSVVGAPALMQGHSLAGSSVVSASSVSAPALTQSYSLTGSGLVSASSVSTPALSQVHSLSGADLVSASYVSSPSMGGGVALTPDGLVSASYVSAPAITQAHSLSGGTVSASFALSTPVLSQAHSIAAAGLVSASDVGAPALTQTHALSGAGLVSGSYLSQPVLIEAAPVVFTPSPERTLILGAQSRQVVTYAQSRLINAAVQRG